MFFLLMRCLRESCDKTNATNRLYVLYKQSLSYWNVRLCDFCMTVTQTHAHIWRLSLWLVLIQIIGMFYVSHQRWKLICVEMFKEALHTNNHRIKEFFSWDVLSVEQIKSNVGAKTFPSAVKQKKSFWIISAFTSVGITDARVWCSVILFRFFTD